MIKNLFRREVHNQPPYNIVALVAVSLIFLFFFSLTLVSAQSPYSDCNTYGNCQPVSTGTTTIQTNLTIYQNTSETDPIFIANNASIWNAIWARLTQAVADTLYYPLSSNPAGYFNSSNYSSFNATYNGVIGNISYINNATFNQSLTDSRYIPYVNAIADILFNTKKIVWDFGQIWGNGLDMHINSSKNLYLDAQTGYGVYVSPKIITDTINTTNANITGVAQTGIQTFFRQGVEVALLDGGFSQYSNGDFLFWIPVGANLQWKSGSTGGAGDRFTFTSAGNLSTVGDIIATDYFGNGRALTGISTWNLTYNNILNQNCPAGKVVNGTLANGTIRCTTSGTSIYPIDYNAMCYSNSSGAILCENLSIFLSDNNNLTIMNLNGSLRANGLFSSGIPYNLTGTGINYTFSGTGYSKNIICPNNDCKFTQEVEMGDWIALSTCAGYDEVASVVNDNKLAMTSNLIGSGCSNTYQSLTGRFTMYKPLKVYDITGALAFSIHPVTKALLAKGDITLANGGTFGCSGNCNFNAIGGSGIFTANSVELLKLLATGGVQFSNVLAIFGNDGVGGAGGGLKTEAVIRGATNGGSTNGGGNPLRFSVQSIGNNALAYIKFQVGQPVASGTGAQTLQDILTIMYNGLYVNGTLNMTSQTGNTRNDIVGVKNMEINGNVSILGNSNLTGNVDINGNLSVKRPYGMFSSTEIQSIATSSTPYPMTFNWTENSYQIYKTSDNINFSFARTGNYLVELSIIAQGNQGDKIEIWTQKNGKNIPRSNTIYDFKGTNANAVIAVPFIISMNTTDNFKVMYAGSANTTKLQYTTNTSYSPETPSAIMTITKLSELTQ